MASFNIYNDENQFLLNRYRSISDEIMQDETFALSLERWQSTFESDQVIPAEKDLRNLLINLKAIPPLLTKTKCPVHRVFISHRQIDKDFGLSIANIANDNGFDFWLDVHNPALSTLPGIINISSKQLALLTACIIEMGLINSTHVLAVMTKKTKGSQWVPYEYGRVRNINNTACWQHPNHKFILPDYMQLGATLHDKNGITNWLKGFKPTCNSLLWRWPKTKTLP